MLYRHVRHGGLIGNITLNSDRHCDRTYAETLCREAYMLHNVNTAEADGTSLSADAMCGSKHNKNEK
jgi:hypothetical protein